MPTIDDLQIEITHSSQDAVKGIDALTASLERLKRVAQGGVGLTGVANQFRKLNEALKSLENPAEKINQLVSALKPLQNIQKSNLNSTLNSLKKVPEITKQLATMDMGSFASQIERVVAAVKPLATEMNKVAAGFSAFPTKIQKLITSKERLTQSSNKLSRSYGILGTGITRLQAKMGILIFAFRRAANVISGWVTESNAFVENLNLFRVSLREGADEALEYAYKVREAFGVDPSEWIRFQAVFQNMMTGFGIVGEKAEVMSRNLTQLGYDLATIFNVDYSVAMRKLESAIAGQPRPMREWGFDISETTLKMVALEHGIKQNVETMTQYEKSQLRYLQIMQTAQKQGILGNFAREIHTPANAFRILNQQILQFRRALGDMLIPILLKILPYIQAFVKLLTDAARALANFFGFTLPIIDYSNIGNIAPISDDIGDIGDSADEATGAVKKLRTVLMGFDELNLLPQQSSSGVGGGGSGIGGGGGGFEIDPSIYDYDFLGDIKNKVNEIADNIYQKIRPFVEWLKDNFHHILDVVIAVGAGLLAWKVTTAMMSLFSTLSELFNRFKAGEPNIALGIALTISGIVLGASGIANLVAGTGDIMDVIKAVIGAALGVGGALIAFGTGPLGWAIGIGAVLTMTIAGFVIGTNRRIDALIQEAIGDNGGTLITELSKAFSNLMEEIGSGFDPIIEGGEKLKEHKANIDRSKQSIETLFNVIQSNAGDSAIELEKLIGAMTNLLDETQLLRDQAYGNIVHALSNSFTDVQKTVGVATKEIVKDILLIKNEGDEKLTNAQMKIREYQKAWQKGEISIEEATKGIMEQYNTISGGRGIVDEVGDSFLGLVTKLDRIDWVTPTERSKALEEIGESAKRAKEKADEYFDAMTESIEVFLKDIDDPKLRQEFASKLYLFRDEERDAVYKRITDNLELLFGAMQTDLTRSIQDVSDKASSDWDNMEWWQKLGSTKPQYVAQAIERFKTETMDPVSEEVNKILADFGIEGGEEMQRAVENILDKGFEWDPIYGYVYDFSGELSNVTTEEIEKMEALFGKNAKEMGIAIPIEMASGIDSKVNDLKKTLESQNNTVTRMISTDPSFLKLLSTSRLAGLNIDSEMAKGLKDNLKLIEDEATGTVTGIKNSITGEVTNVTPILVENLKTLGINIATGLEEGVDEGVVEEDYRNIFQRIGDWFKNLFGINSPSTVFHELGSNLSQGLLNGVNDQINTDKKKWDIWSLLPWNWFSSANEISSNKSSLFNRGGKTIMNSLLEGMDGFDNKFETIFQNAVEAARTVFNEFIDWLNRRMRFKWDAITIAGKTIVPAGSVQLFRIPHIPKLFAEGGFPETGQLFIARESGAEMVGSIGRRTAVANNDQIVDGIAAGVYEANSEQNVLLREQNALLRAILEKGTTINLDGKEIARSVEKVQRERGATLLSGGVVFG